MKTSKEKNIQNELTNLVDRKSILWTITILIAFVLLGYWGMYSKSEEPNYVSKLTMQTEGLVYSIESMEVGTQGWRGFTTTIIGYKIKYRYKIDGTSYANERIINNKIGNLNDLKTFSENQNKWIFMVKYSKADPNISYLTTKQHKIISLYQKNRTAAARATIRFGETKRHIF